MSIGKKNKIFVAGHTGLVGSAIVRELKRKGYKKIQICKIPNTGPGIAINDRIRKASKF